MARSYKRDKIGRFAATGSGKSSSSSSAGGARKGGAPKSVIRSKYGAARSTKADIARSTFLTASRKKSTKPETRTWANGGFSGTVDDAMRRAAAKQRKKR